MSEEFLWNEKWRPKSVGDCVLPNRLKVIFQGYVDSGQIPNLMLTGGPGIGKTTVARAMCEEIGLDYIFINSSEERGIDTLRVKIKNYASTLSLSGGRKVIILDEADYLTPEAQAALRGVIEEFSENCSFIFTCNFKTKLIEALHSRTSVIDCNLRSDEKPKVAGALFKRLKEVLNSEGVKYEESALVKVIEKFFPDYRRIINELQRFATVGDIDAGIVTQLTDIRKIGDLISYLKDKNFSEMRKWVVANSDVEPHRIMRKIYDGLSDYLKPESIPQTIVTLARYQYQAGFVPDQEINLCACLTEIMVDAEFK